ncbi:hypothetical protein [Brucella anthropi]|uniref:Uncharacterized protein n=1 Tax=Brucella anthropi TaxID=529 RepID=A0A6L3ZAH8_BRUAN|nr:hypothetical protein [Brucella anthropi]KAB2773261.1 hypothetical protein F9L04_00010 [Brucella anthropi]
METTLEFLTTRKPVREVRRQWPDEVKAKIVLESFCRGIIRDEQTAKVCCRPEPDGLLVMQTSVSFDNLTHWRQCVETALPIDRLFISTILDIWKMKKQ